jgi:hypothetical protein
VCSSLKTTILKSTRRCGMSEKQNAKEVFPLPF